MQLVTPQRLLVALSITLLVGSVVPPIQSCAQDACCFEPTYRLQCETVMEPQQVQRMKLTYQTDYVNELVTRYRPVLRTRTEQRDVRVAKPVVETSYREDRYTVWKPVVETSYRDETVQRTRLVNETAEREEQYTTYRPVVETQYYQQRYMVQRPVTSTQYYDQRYAVQRPVVETQLQTQQYTAMRPVTTLQNKTYDVGGYVAQQTVTPGSLRYGLSYVPNTHATPGPLGIFARVRGSYAMTPQMTPPRISTQYAYRPNYVTQQYAQTAMVPETKQVQVPVQTTRMQTDYMTQRVPVQTTRMQTEIITKNVPVQTTRMVATTQVRKVPYVVTRPVTETLTRKVPVQQQRWVTEEKVRKVPVQTTRMEYITKKVPYQVSYYEQEAYTQTVRKPITSQVYVPYAETVMMPRQVVQRVALSYYDPFSSAIANGYSSFMPLVESAVAPVDSYQPTPSTSPFVAPEVVQPSTLSGESILDHPRSLGPVPEVRSMRKIEMSPSTNGSSGRYDDMDLFDDKEDHDELPAPSLDGPRLNRPESSGSQSTESEVEAKEAGWKIRYLPSFAREA